MTTAVTTNLPYIPRFSIIVAVSATTRGIGYQGKIPWKNSKDMAFFRKTTREVPSEDYTNVIIMGRKTFESLGGVALPARLNIVCSSCMEPGENHTTGVVVVKTLNEALEFQPSHKKIHKRFVIGGEQLYREAMLHPGCEELYINHLIFSPGAEPVCDTFFPPVDTDVYTGVDAAVYTCDNSQDMMGSSIIYKHYIRNYTLAANPQRTMMS
jgi:dihydrofolate reductase